MAATEGFGEVWPLDAICSSIAGDTSPGAGGYEAQGATEGKGGGSRGCVVGKDIDARRERKICSGQRIVRHHNVAGSSCNHKQLQRRFSLSGEIEKRAF